MSEHKEQSESYRSAREAFDGLNIEEKASFLVESAVRMIARGVDQAGTAVADAVEEIVQEMNKCRDQAAEEGNEAAAADAAKPKTARKKTSSKKTTRKKASDQDG